MANKSKQKGNNFERVVAKMFSDLYKDRYGAEVSFQRNISSGSIFGGSNHQRGMNTLQEMTIYAGDIITPNDFLYTIECKHYAIPFSINAIIIQDSKQLDGWIEQVTQDCEVSGKEPMLVIKYDNIKPFVLLKNGYGTPLFRYKEWGAYNFENYIKENKDHMVM